MMAQLGCRQAESLGCVPNLIFGLSFLPPLNASFTEQGAYSFDSTATPANYLEVTPSPLTNQDALVFGFSMSLWIKFPAGRQQASSDRKVILLTWFIYCRLSLCGKYGRDNF